jgi:hypothetical protein
MTRVCAESRPHGRRTIRKLKSEFITERTKGQLEPHVRPARPRDEVARLSTWPLSSFLPATRRRAEARQIALSRALTATRIRAR